MFWFSIFAFYFCFLFVILFVVFAGALRLLVPLARLYFAPACVSTVCGCARVSCSVREQLCFVLVFYFYFLFLFSIRFLFVVLFVVFAGAAEFARTARPPVLCACMRA